MHELSIARMLIRMIQRHAPADAVVRGVRVEAGPMRAIEPEAMRLAWRAATADTPLHGAALDLCTLPFDLTCPACGRRWSADDLFETCACGCDRPRARGGDELILVSIDVHSPDSGDASAPHSKEISRASDRD